MSEYGVYLSFNNQEEGFRLPINPSRIEMKDGSTGSTYDITSLGEINVIKSRKLTKYHFEGIFPALGKGYPFMATDLLLEPQVYIDYIEKWMESKRPIRFNFVGSTFDINVPASIEHFDWREVAGSVGDIEYSIGLKKYTFYAARRVTVGTNNAQTTETQSTTIQKQEKERENDRVPPKTYKLASGDTLWTVAKSQLGNGDLWRSIQTLNNITDAEIKRLPAGKVLKLPDARNVS